MQNKTSTSVFLQNTSKIIKLIIAVGSLGIFLILIGRAISVEPNIGVIFIVLPILITLFLYALKKTTWLLISMITVSASITSFRDYTVELGNTSLTLSGLIWIFFAGFILVYLFVFLKKIWMPRYSFSFFLLTLWAIIRWGINPTGFAGIKDILWYGFPLLIILYIHNIYQKKSLKEIKQQASRLEKVILFSVLIPVGLYIIALSTGLAEMTSRGPRGPIIGDSRAIPLYALVVLSLALANSRYGDLLKTGRLFSIISTGLIWFTLGRMVSFLALGLLIFRQFVHKFKWQLFVSAAITVTVGYYATTNIPILRDRFFFTDDWSITLETGIYGINTAGRNRMWETVYQSAIPNWMIGKGIGSARQVTALLFANSKGVSEYQPHNEYLQVFHDLGVPGLLLLVIAWGTLFYRSWMRWENSRAIIVKKWSMASIMAIGVVLISSTTDNTIHYPFVTIPAIIITVISEVMEIKLNDEKSTYASQINKQE